MIGTFVARPALSLSGLRGIALLQGLADDVLAEVAAACHFQLVRARQAVMTRADADRDCYLVLSGRLRVVALAPGGREVSFRDAVAGDMFGELAALDGRARSATVLALQESLLAALRPDQLHSLMRRHWQIGQRMLQHLARTTRALTERVYELSTLSVQQRLCAELLRLALAAEGQQGARVLLEEMPSHKELSARIGTSREEVTRALGELMRLGIVHTEGEQHKRVVIGEVHRLAQRIEAAAPLSL
jgi:CRP-like cAMP-binding protein